jgi:hypothetical protein
MPKSTAYETAEVQLIDIVGTIGEARLAAFLVHALEVRWDAAETDAEAEELRRIQAVAQQVVVGLAKLEDRRDELADERVCDECAAKCPGCGCKPGDGRTPGCTHPVGCGYTPLPPCTKCGEHGHIAQDHAWGGHLPKAER